MCHNSPAQGDRIVCVKAGDTSTGNIDIDVSGIDIDTTADEGSAGTNDGGHGVILKHEGTGNIELDITGTTTGGTTTPSTIDTTGDNAKGIVLWHVDLQTNNGRAGNVTVTLSDIEINTSGSGATGQQGIYARNSGNGDLTVNLNPGVTISTNGNNSTGMYLVQDSVVGDNDVILNARGITVTTQGGGTLSNAIWAERITGRGDVRLDIRDSTLSTTGDGTYGIRANHSGGSNSIGDIDIDLEGGRITTNGYLAHGIYAHRQKANPPPGTPTGNIEIRTRNHAIETTGTAHHSGLQGTYAYGMLVSHESDGNIIVDLEEGSSVTTHGKNSHGIVTYHYGDQDTRSMDVTVSGSITTNGEAAQGVRMGTGGPARMAGLDSQGYRRQTATVNGSITSTGEGVYLANGGRVVIGPEGRIRSGSGIAILATGTVPEDNTDPQNVVPAILPKLRVDFNLDGHQRVADAIGDDWILNDGGETTIAVNRTVLHDGGTGATGATAANGVWDVTMLADGLTVTDRSTDPWTTSARDSSTITDRDFSASDFTEVEVREPPPPPGPPTEPEAQVHRINEVVSVGPDAAAGVHVEGDGEVYIGAQGRIEAASGIAILATGEAPNLLVDVTLDERRVAQVIGDDWIINDGGGTTLVINEVKLHDGATGVVPEVSAPNGAFDVRVRAEGVRVLDRTDPDPANWTISDLAAGVIADRDFSVADFIETRKEPEPAQPMFVEEYAPRAALYESLPGLLLRLDAGAPVRRPEEPAWAQVGYGAGRGEADHSETGASYDFDRIETAAGISRAWGDALGGSLWLRRLQSEVKVDMPAGSGELELHGVGAGVQGHWREAGGLSVSGELSWTDFDVDATSEKRGRLARDVGADLWQARLEAAVRLEQENGLTLLPRAWAWHAQADVDDFTDTVGAQVSGVDESRTAAGLGLRAELDGSESSLYGSVDVEHVVGGEETAVEVSGQALESESEKTRVWLGMGGQRQGRRVTLRGGLRLADPGGRNQEVSASVSVSGSF